MKFYCDEMLIKLGRWLRLAGHDTRIASNGIADKLILQQAVHEQRTLITRDHKLCEFRQAENIVVLLNCKIHSDCIIEITQRLNIDWLYRPFSRCMGCNSLLQLVDSCPLEKLPENVQKNVKKLWYCERCDQLFWQGSHVHRMRQKLVQFSNIKSTQ